MPTFLSILLALGTAYTAFAQVAPPRSDFKYSINELFTCETQSPEIPLVIVQAEIFQNAFSEGDKYFRPEIVVRSSEASMQSAAKYWFFWDRRNDHDGDPNDSNIIKYELVDINLLSFGALNGNQEPASIQRNGQGGRIRINGKVHTLRNCKNSQNI